MRYTYLYRNIYSKSNQIYRKTHPFELVKLNNPNSVTPCTGTTKKSCTGTTKSHCIFMMVLCIIAARAIPNNWFTFATGSWRRIPFSGQNYGNEFPVPAAHIRILGSSGAQNINKQSLLVSPVISLLPHWLHKILFGGLIESKSSN